MLMDEIAKCYQKYIEDGVPEEDARFVLPNACKTNMVITANDREWFHMFKLRIDEQSQWEIRRMFQRILKEFMTINPLIFEGIICGKNS